MSLTGCSPALRDARQLVGDPVDVLTGANVDQTLDFRLAGPLELRWYRHYDSSQSHRRLAMGWGQTHEFDRVLWLDADGIRYVAPPGRILGFQPLTDDGAECARHGFVLRRLAIRKYHLLRHGEPSMVFEFHHPLEPARLARLYRGEHQIVFGYDGTNALVSIRDAAGRLIRVIEEHGQLLRLSLAGEGGAPDLLLAAYHYDDRGNLIRTENADGHGYAFAYDDANRLIRRTGRTGFKFYFDYDPQGRCVRAVGAYRLHGVALQYDPDRQMTQVTRADLGVWKYFYDDAGLTEIVDPLGGAQRFVRDASGRITTELDANGNATRIDYDAAGAPIARVNALGHRVALPADPNAPEPDFHRVAANPAEYEFGRLLDVRAITLPEAPDMQRFPVQPLGVLWWPEPEAGRIFNDLGKLTEQVDASGRRRHWRYDPSGNLSGYTDFDGGRWTEVHGLWHFETELSNPLDAEVRFTWTSEGEIASCLDPEGTLSEYRYDLKDKLAEVRRHGVVRDNYTRDAVGNLVAKHGSDGRELLRLEIGPGNLLLTRTLASGDEHRFEYDAFGRQLAATTRQGRVEFGYDEWGNLRRDQRNGEGVVHRYQGWRRPAESTLFQRFSVRYEWPDEATLRITDPGGRSHLVRFLANGLLERHFSNGSQETAQYDNMGRCLFKALARNGRVWSRRYHWSGEGELRRVEDSRFGEIRHDYDAAHRLSRRTLDGRAEVYAMDLADNLLSQPGLEGVVLREGNRLKTANGFRFAYDDRNHIAVRETAAGLVRYGYDSRDQLVRVESPDGDWHAEYDALGRRSSKTFAGRRTEFFWSADQLIAERDAAGRLRVYVHTDPLALTPFMFVDYDSVEASPESGLRYFIVSDQVGAPCEIRNEHGAEVWRAQTAPYGQVAVAQGAVIEFNLRLPGHYADDELGLHYNRFRHYDPQLGRYLQSDPWGISGGFNLYAYRLNPLDQVDVRGLGEENKKKGKPCPDEEGTITPTNASENSLVPVVNPAGAIRANQYSKNWPSQSLSQSVSSIAGLNPIVTYTNSGKTIYTNPVTGIQVVHDISGNYFRVVNPGAKGNAKYLDSSGNVIPDNVSIFKPNKTVQAGVPSDVRQGLTHFNNSDPLVP